MTSQRRYTAMEVALIVEHTTAMIAAAQSALTTLQSINKATRPEYVANHIKYYKNIIGGYKWAIQLAKQREAKKAHVNRPTV